MGIKKGHRKKGDKEKKTTKPKHVLFGLRIQEQEFRVYFPIFSFDSEKKKFFFLVGGEKTYTMLGWRDYREDGKQWVENGVENSVFHCLGSKEKQRGWKIQKKIFLPDPPIFFLPNREENCGEKAVLNVKLHKCPLPPTLLTNTTAVLESSKKKKPETESWRKKKRESTS